MDYQKPDLLTSLKNMERAKFYFYNIKTFLTDLLSKLTHLLTFLKNMERVKFYLYNIKTFLTDLRSKLIKQVEKLTGYQWYELLDALFFASFLLLTYKFLFRLMFSANPYWLINLSIYFISFVIGLKFNGIYFVRENAVWVWKFLLGKDFWYFKPENYWSNLQEGEFDQSRIPKLNNSAWYNKIFQSVFTALILLRLFLFKEIYFSILANFFIVYFLIFQNLLLSASLFSAILLLSRIIMFSAAHTTQDLFKMFHKYEFFADDETIKPTWKNAKILSLWITSSYVDRKLHNNELKETNEIDILYALELTTYFYYKYIQVYEFPTFIMNTDVAGMTMYAKTRLAIAQTGPLDSDDEEEYPYFQLLETTKKNKFFLLAIPLPIQVLDNCKKYFSRAHYEGLLNSSKFFGAKNTNFSGPLVKYQPNQYHPTKVRFFDRILYFVNKSTVNPFKDISPADLAKHVDAIGYHGTIEVIKQKHLTEKEAIETEQEIQEEIKKGNLVPYVFDKDYIPFVQKSEIELIAFQYDNDLSYKASIKGIVQPSFFSHLKHSYNYQDVSKEQVLEGLKKIAEFSKLMSGYKEHQLNSLQRDLYEEQQLLIERRIEKIEKLNNFKPERSAIMDFYLFKIDTLIEQLKNNPNEPPIKIVVETLSALHETIYQEKLDKTETTLKYMHNCHSVKESQGGLPTKAMRMFVESAGENEKWSSEPKVLQAAEAKEQANNKILNFDKSKLKPPTAENPKSYDTKQPFVCNHHLVPGQILPKNNILTKQTAEIKKIDYDDPDN